MRSKLWLTGIVIFGLLITALTSSVAYRTETELAKSRYLGVVDAFSSYVLREMQRTGTILFTLKGFIDSQQQLQYDTLLPVVSGVMKNFDRLQGVLWVPKVAAENRQLFEMENSRGGYYSIFEVVNGVPSPATERPFYFPVQFQLAEDGPIIPPGFDLGGSGLAQYLPAMGEAGERMFILPMFDQDNPGMAAAPSMGSQSADGGLMVLTPTYADQRGAKDFANLRGFLVTVIRSNPLSEDSSWGVVGNVEIGLTDYTDPANPVKVLPSQGFAEDELVRSMAFKRNLPLVGGLNWEIEAVPTKAFIDSRRTKQPLLIFCGGLLSTALSAGFFIFLIRQNKRINQVVEYRTRELNEANRQLEILSATDGLTGLANRRHFDQYLEQEWQRAYRSQKPITLVLADIDEFKRFNDLYGHIAGDSCLQKVAGVMHANFSRPADLVARYGGEEFAVIIPDMDQISIELGERCREAVADLRVPHEGSGVAGYLTLSVGVCSLVPAPGMEPADIVRFADEALYRAKQSGRNRSIMSDRRKDVHSDQFAS